MSSAGTPAARWRADALCWEEQAAPELFFPIGTTGPAMEQAEAAKEVCRRCPVITQCLEWALATRQDAGVWGGKTEDERRLVHRRGRARQYDLRKRAT